MQIWYEYLTKENHLIDKNVSTFLVEERQLWFKVKKGTVWHRFQVRCTSNDLLRSCVRILRRLGVAISVGPQMKETVYGKSIKTLLDSIQFPSADSHSSGHDTSGNSTTATTSVALSASIDPSQTHNNRNILNETAAKNYIPESHAVSALNPQSQSCAVPQHLSLPPKRVMSLIQNKNHYYNSLNSQSRHVKHKDVNNYSSNSHSQPL